jgi:hypothetical protein
MKTHYTVIVLDASGSMGSMREEALDACNEQIKDLRKATKEGDLHARVGLIKFGSKVEKSEIWNKPVSGVRNVKHSDYTPRGMTAMLDAVGMAIEKLLELPDINDPDTAVLVNIISDGIENNSKQYTYGDVAEKISHLQSTGRWTFTYSGANQNLAIVTSKMNIPKGNTQSWARTGEGFTNATQDRKMSNNSYFKRLRRRVLSDDKGDELQISDYYSAPIVDKDDDDNKEGV